MYFEFKKTTELTKEHFIRIAKESFIKDDRKRCLEKIQKVGVAALHIFFSTVDQWGEPDVAHLRIRTVEEAIIYGTKGEDVNFRIMFVFNDGSTAAETRPGKSLVYILDQKFYSNNLLLKIETPNGVIEGGLNYIAEKLSSYLEEDKSETKYHIVKDILEGKDTLLGKYPYKEKTIDLKQYSKISVITKHRDKDDEYDTSRGYHLIPIEDYGFEVEYWAAIEKPYFCKIVGDFIECDNCYFHGRGGCTKERVSYEEIMYLVKNFHFIEDGSILKIDGTIDKTGRV